MVQFTRSHSPAVFWPVTRFHSSTSTQTFARLPRPFSLSDSLVGDNLGTSLVEVSVGLPDANGNLIGGPVHGVIDPLLGPLADNGGFALPDGGRILTRGLLSGSPAINAGDLNAVAGQNGVPEFDERGMPYGRVVGGRIDIGAFEYEAPSDLNLTVDTLVDESDANYSRGDLSLREALELADKNPGPDTIHFDPALTASGPATIVLSYAFGSTHLSLFIGSSVSIVGPGATLLTIDASGNDPTPQIKDVAGSRVFKISATPSLSTGVAISGVTLTGGDSDTTGGAILANGVNLTLDEKTIADNSTRQRGGGISFGNGTLTVRHSTIANNNSGASGGEIYTYIGNLTISDSTISGNSVTGIGGQGGGVYFTDRNIATSSQLQISRRTISENSSATFGGGLAAKIVTGVMTLDDDTFVGNSSAASGIHQGFGGGITVSVFGGPLSIIDSSVSGNMASSLKGQGRGVLLRGDGGTATLRNTVVEHNVATTSAGQGGGISASGIPLTIDSSTVSDNSAGLSGGGAYSTSALTATGSKIAGNTAAQGGGIFSAGGRAIIEGCSVLNNLASGSGGGISGPNLIVTDSIISGNTAAGSGGGVYSADAIMLVRSEIEQNSAGVDGGGIGVSHYRHVVVSDCKIEGNSAARSGGAISGVALLSNSTLSGNTEGALGGGVYTHLCPDHSFNDCI
jgi:predicted outer membrane repeat protein